MMKNIFGLTLIILVLFPNFNLSCAGDPYVKTTEIKCKDVKVQIKTECLDDTNKAFPNCISQNISFIDYKTGKSITIPSSGKLTKNSYDPIRILDTLVSKLACVEGGNAIYLLIGYYNGGNCEECEWYEILDLSGKNLASSRKIKGLKGKYENFNEAYKKFGLPEPWPRKFFVDINLSRNK